MAMTSWSRGRQVGLQISGTKFQGRTQEKQKGTQLKIALGKARSGVRISCLIEAIVASRFSRFETVSSSVNDRRAGCLLLNLRRACSSVEIPSS